MRVPGYARYTNIATSYALTGYKDDLENNRFGVKAWSHNRHRIAEILVRIFILRGSFIRECVQIHDKGNTFYSIQV